jgi:hypothetical protein
MPFSAPPELDCTVRALALAICSPVASRSLYLRAHFVCHDLRRAVRTQSTDDRASSDYIATVRPKRVAGPVNENIISWVASDYEEEAYLGPGNTATVPEDASQRLLDFLASGDLRQAVALVDRLSLTKSCIEAEVGSQLLEGMRPGSRRIVSPTRLFERNVRCVCGRHVPSVLASTTNYLSLSS